MTQTNIHVGVQKVCSIYVLMCVEKYILQTALWPWIILPVNTTTGWDLATVYEVDCNKTNSRKVHVKKVTAMPTLWMLNSSERTMELVEIYM